MGDTDVCPWDMGTFGSLSIRQFGPDPARGRRRSEGRPAAARRRAAAGAGRRSEGRGRRRRRGTDAVDARHLRPAHRGQADRAAARGQGRRSRPCRRSRSSGRSAPRRDAHRQGDRQGEVRRRHRAARRAARAHPAPAGARRRRSSTADTSAAEAVPGVRVVRDGDLVAVLHEHRDEADARSAWSRRSSRRRRRRSTTRTSSSTCEKTAPAAQTVAEGGVAGRRREGSPEQRVEETYLHGYVAHAPMETHSAVARVREREGDGVGVDADAVPAEVAGRQGAEPRARQGARHHAVRRRRVRRQERGAAGDRGGARSRCSPASRCASSGAARRSSSSTRSIRRPSSRSRSGLDAAKKIVFWDYHVDRRRRARRGAVLRHPAPPDGRAGRLEREHAGLPPVRRRPVARARRQHERLRARVAHRSAWRRRRASIRSSSAGRTSPIQRMMRVLEAAAKQFGWTPKPAPSGRGVGVALGIDAGTYVATHGGGARGQERPDACRSCASSARRTWASLVNPEGARQQMEGCITMGLGYALTEEVRFRNGEVLDRNFDTYELPRFSWLPTIETDDPRLARPAGAGRRRAGHRHDGRGHRQRDLRRDSARACGRCR